MGATVLSLQTGLGILGMERLDDSMTKGTIVGI